MSDLDIGTEIARGIREFEHVTQDELARAVREAWQPDPFPYRSDARDAAGYCCRGAGGVGAKFTVQPLPQPGQGCRECWVIWHSYANGVPMSKTEVAITNGGQVVVIHPRFRLDDVDERRREPITLRDVLGAIYGEDVG
jgi:hypothetical protein